MKQFPFETLPQPLALSVHKHQKEELAHSADTLSELTSTLVEFIGTLALMDYFEGKQDPTQCAPNANLNNWIISSLMSGAVGAGLWARWT